MMQNSAWSRCLLFALTLWSCQSAARVEVVVSVVPLKFITERIGGQNVQVQSLVQPGHSPVTYEPTARQMAALAGARLYVRTGVPFERVWMDRIEESNPALRVVDVRERIALQAPHLTAVALGTSATEPHEHEAHGHDQLDPHVWLDPSLAKTIAGNIRDGLVKEDPDHADDYRRNTKTLLDQLDQLDMEIREILAGIENRKFLVFHPAWGYFAKAYDLQQIAVEHRGREPGPKALVELVGITRRERINTVFAQKQFSTRVVETLAAEIDGNVVVLDPLAEDYLNNLRHAALAIAGKDGG